jgi:hypothetical protein
VLNAVWILVASALALVAFVVVRAKARRAKIAALKPPGRAMGMFEHAFDCMHHMGALVILQIVRIDGALGESTLRRALDAVQLMHPLLGVHVTGPGGIFEAEGTEPIPLRVVVRDGTERWRSEALAELHRPIPYGTHPLMRAVWLGGEDEGELLLVSNHAILDGYSMAFLVRDLLELCVTIDAGKPVEIAPPSSRIVPAVDQCLPERAHGPKPKGGPLTLIPTDATAPSAERHSRVEYLVVPAEAVRRLLDRSREESTTVNGAMCAAGLLALRSVIDTDRELSLQTQVSVRGELVPPVSNETVGSFISGVTTTHLAAQTTQFWDLAREARHRVSAALDRGDHLTILKGSFGALHAFGLRFLGPRFNAGRIVAINVSNSGNLPVPLVYGPRRIRELYALASQHVIGSMMQVAVWTVGGTMFIALTYVEPLLSRAHALAMISGFERLLARAREPGDFSLLTMPQYEQRTDAA